MAEEDEEVITLDTDDDTTGPILIADSPVRPLDGDAERKRGDGKGAPPTAETRKQPTVAGAAFLERRRQQSSGGATTSPGLKEGPAGYVAPGFEYSKHRKKRNAYLYIVIPFFQTHTQTRYFTTFTSLFVLPFFGSPALHLFTQLCLWCSLLLSAGGHAASGGGQSSRSLTRMTMTMTMTMTMI